jgi:WD40 repeat protein
MRPDDCRRRSLEPEPGLRSRERRTSVRARVPRLSGWLLAVIVAAVLASSWLSAVDVLQEIGPARAHRAPGEIGTVASSIAISPTGTMMATINTSGFAALRAFEHDWNIERFLDAPGYLRVAAYSPDGQFLAAAGNGPQMQLWHGESHREHEQLPLTINDVKYLQFSPDGQTLAIAPTSEGTIVLFDLPGKHLRHTLKHAFSVTGLSFSPNGRHLASAGRFDTWITIWDLETHSARYLPTDVPCDFRAFTGSPDGKYLATVQYADRRAKLWNLTTGTCRIFEGPGGIVHSIAFSPNGQTLAVAGNGRTLSLWQVPTGKHLANLDGDSLWLRNVLFSRDGQNLFATGDDDDLRIWNIGDLSRNAPSTQDLTLLACDSTRPGDHR